MPPIGASAGSRSPLDRRGRPVVTIGARAYDEPGLIVSILTLLEMEAAEGKVDEVKAVLEKHLGDTRARPGCELVTVHQDQGDPNVILLIERWASRADDEAYHAWRAGDGAIPEMAGLVVRGSLRYFDDVDA